MNAMATQEQQEQRQKAVADFAQSVGFDLDGATPLFQDASPRKYYRNMLNGRSVLLMDMPPYLPTTDKVKEFFALSRYLRKIGLKTPQIFEADEEQGIALIEDFGDAVYGDLIDSNKLSHDKLTQLFLDAIDVLAHLHKNFDADDVGVTLPSMQKRLEYELPQLTNWGYPGRKNHETPPDVVAEYMLIWKKLIADLPPLDPMISMIDYHAPNLMRLESGNGKDRVGVIDYQDAVIGSPAYDVMSLLEDDRRTLSLDIREKALNRYFDQMEGRYDRDVFERHIAFWSAQRHAKNIGNFVRITVQRHEDRYLGYIPTAGAWLELALEHEFLLPLKKWFDKNLPDYKAPLSDVRKWIK
jgi:aminoglycoside/choline kinase family phosphotransferase